MGSYKGIVLGWCEEVARNFRGIEGLVEEEDDPIGGWVCKVG